MPTTEERYRLLMAMQPELINWMQAAMLIAGMMEKVPSIRFDRLFIFVTMILYRAVSADEYKDYMLDETFRLGDNTLEAKQFFKSETAVLEYVRATVKRSFKPPYKHILTIEVDNECFAAIAYFEQYLDGFEAITIPEDDLPSFNNCVIFTYEQNV
jgi:hypothetical protein